MSASTLDPRLLRLTAVPFWRVRTTERVLALIERYRLVLAPANDAPSQEARTLRLLREHPSALLEEAALDPLALASRLDAALAELRNLKAAAPIPAPADKDERAFILALADLQHFFREMRLIRRRLARLPPEPLLAWYKAEAGRSDPLEGLDVEVIRAIGQIRRGHMLRVAAELAAIRHGVPDLRARLAPPHAPERPAGPGVFVCRAGEIPEGGARCVEVEGRAVAVFNDRGVLRAIDDHCPHRGGPLHKGDLDEGCAVCPLHGWAFDLETGAMRGNPRIQVSTYALEARADEVFVLGPKGPKR